MLEYTGHFLIALALNIFVETAVLVALVRNIFKIGQENIATTLLIIAGVFANIATLPYVWYIFPILIYRSYFLAIGIGEVTATIFEALFYCMFLKVSLRKSIIASVLANGASYFFVSFLIRIIFSG